MKIIKKTLYVILSMAVLLLLFIMVVMVMNHRRTAYLDMETPPRFEQQRVLIRNVNLVPMTRDTVLPNKTVLIEKGRISKIEDTLHLEGVAEIDAENKFLVPGLIDMHVHVWDRYELGLYLANGVTAVRNLWGMPLHLRIKNELADGEIIGPMFFTSGPKLTGMQDQGEDKVQVSDPYEAKSLVKEYKDRGYNFIKTYAGMPDDIFEAVREQAMLSEIDMVVHPSFERDYQKNFLEQVATLEHAEDIVQQALDYQLDSIKLEAVAREMAVSKVSFSPTLTGFYKIYEMLADEAILETEAVHYINPFFKSVDSEAQVSRWQNEKNNNVDVVDRIRKQHEFHLYCIKKLHEAGVNIVCSTDAGIGITAPGYSIHQELDLYKKAGMNNFEVLKTATINPSLTHDEFADMGSIEIDKRANFILCDKNPLEDLSTLKEPDFVMVRGNMIKADQLKIFESKARDRNNMIPTALYMLENLWVEK